MSSISGNGLHRDKDYSSYFKTQKDDKSSLETNAKTKSVGEASLHVPVSSSGDTKAKDVDVKPPISKDNDYVKDLFSLVEKLSSSVADPTVDELVRLKFLIDNIQSVQEEKLNSLNFWEVSNMFTGILGTSLLSKANNLFSGGYGKLDNADQKFVHQHLDLLNKIQQSSKKAIPQQETRQIADVTFIGHFNSEGRLEGEGQIIYPGAIHKGNFKNGLLDGIGEIIFKEYTVRGFFEDGDLKDTYALTRHEGVTQTKDF